MNQIIKKNIANWDKYLKLDEELNVVFKDIDKHIVQELSLAHNLHTTHKKRRNGMA